MEITNIEGFKPKELVLKDDISKVYKLFQRIINIIS